MASPCVGFSGLKRPFKVQYEDSLSHKADLKVLMWLITILAGLTQIIKPSLLKLDLLYW